MRPARLTVSMRDGKSYFGVGCGGIILSDGPAELSDFAIEVVPKSPLSCASISVDNFCSRTYLVYTDAPIASPAVDIKIARRCWCGYFCFDVCTASCFVIEEDNTRSDRRVGLPACLEIPFMV